MDLLSAIREALRFTRSTRSMLAQGRPITFHPFDALEACSGQAFHQSPFTFFPFAFFRGYSPLCLRGCV